MKKKLINLYKSRETEFDYVRDTIGEANGPFLMSPNLKYTEQINKVLIIGQETNGWENNSDILSQMNVYEGFNLGEQYYSSPFWNIMRKIERELNNDEYSCAWTNISKFDVEGGSPKGENEDIISKLDSLLVQEIKIIQPDICIFFTGHRLDYRLENIFLNIKFKEVQNFDDKKILCRLEHENLPKKTYRTYHPNYLRRSGIEVSFIEFIKRLV